MPHSALNPSTPTLALVARRRSWLPSLELRPSISRRAKLHRGHHSWARSAIDAAAHRTGVECNMKEGREVFDWFSCRCFWLFFLLGMFRLASMEMSFDCSSCRVLSAFGWKRILRYTLLEDFTDICLAGLILDSSFPLSMKFWVQLRILVEIWAHDDYITGEDVSLDTTEGLWTE
ncbi:hypothetical protein ZIOFF_073593 [Zingiber officinale]|uniref:Uncharacterized protein n=1 Tax=Zingiber officinale TaxID=94328 RepID=A0A8J5EMJ0_ZINOF|nr:hypothetical protein ZIOFF_073593 [Zingiber officinale]